MSFLSNMFGSTKVDTPAPVQSPITTFSGGGLSSRQDGNTFVVSPDAMRTAQVGGLSGNYGTFGDLTGALRGTVSPGFNDLLRTRLDSINDSARKSVGDLRTNLQSRRVLGSSFGQDTLTRANAEFSRQRDAATSDSFLKSLEVNNQLLKQQYDAYGKQYQTGLDELNLEAGMASSLSAKASDIFAANAQLTSKLREQAGEFNAKSANDQASGLGKLLGGPMGSQALSMGGEMFGGLGGLMGGGAAAAGGAEGAAAGIGAAGSELFAALPAMAAI